MKKILFPILISSILFSCGIKKEKTKNDLTAPLVYKNGLYYTDSTSSIPFTGRNKSKMMDQTIEYDVVNGIREGDFIVYYPNNNVQVLGKLSNNKNVGEWKYYNSNGTIESVGNFLDDKPSGTWTWYYPNGKVAEEGKFVDGKRDGDWKSYDSLGSLIILRKYKMDKMIDSTSVK